MQALGWISLAEQRAKNKAKVIFKIHLWLGNSQTIKYLFRGPRNQ